MGEQARNTGILLNNSIDTGLPRVHCDRQAFKRLLTNLLSNAVKFTRAGGEVAVTGRIVEGGDMLLSISDTGIGIAPDKLEHVFGEFEQADSSTTRRFGGTGLGLAITYRFCLMLEGSIDVTSEEGVGSTFTAWLPRKLLQRSLTSSSSR